MCLIWFFHAIWEKLRSTNLIKKGELIIRQRYLRRLQELPWERKDFLQQESLSWHTLSWHVKLVKPQRLDCEIKEKRGKEVLKSRITTQVLCCQKYLALSVLICVQIHLFNLQQFGKMIKITSGKYTYSIQGTTQACSSISKVIINLTPRMQQNFVQNVFK
jgi:hypothetical protein